MVPRGSLDLTWTDWGAAALACLLPGKRQAHELQIAQAWQRLPDQGATSDQQILATLSVRSAWDLLLGTLAFPAGSEVLLSDVTIPGMVAILREHQLVPVPLPIDLATLAIKPAVVAAALTPRTVAILFAPLYGSRTDLSSIVEVAHAAGVLVIEDGAQRFGATSDVTVPTESTADILMLSFGLIKTATALGGGLLITRDADLAQRLRQQHSTLPWQSRWDYLQRVGKALLLKALSNRTLYGLFLGCCNVLRCDPDKLISQGIRSFSGARLFAKMRRQPSSSLLRILCRRVKRFRLQDIRWRRNLAAHISAQFEHVGWPGSATQGHAHWAFPVCSHDPAGLILFLREHGFDATQRASSLVHVAAMDAAGAKANWLPEIVYLPLHPTMTEAEAIRLGQLVEQFETGMLAIEATSEPVTLDV